MSDLSTVDSISGILDDKISKNALKQIDEMIDKRILFVSDRFENLDGAFYNILGVVVERNDSVIKINIPNHNRSLFAIEKAGMKLKYVCAFNNRKLSHLVVRKRGINMNEKDYDFKECMLTGCHRPINSDLCKSHYDSGCRLLYILGRCDYKRPLLTEEELKEFEDSIPFKVAIPVQDKEQEKQKEEERDKLIEKYNSYKPPFKKYLVALSTGGLMEDPELRYGDFEIVEAKDEEHAKYLYNEKHKCTFYFGNVLCEYNEKLEWLIGHSEINADVVDKILDVMGNKPKKEGKLINDEIYERRCNMLTSQKTGIEDNLKHHIFFFVIEEGHLEQQRIPEEILYVNAGGHLVISEELLDNRRITKEISYVYCGKLRHWDSLEDIKQNCVEMTSYYSNIDNGYIGDETWYNRLVLQQKLILIQKSRHENQTCSIGYSPTENKWYGWSHRGFYGFGIGDTVKEGDLVAIDYEDNYYIQHPEEDLRLPVGFKALTINDAKRMAMAYAQAVD